MKALGCLFVLSLATALKVQRDVEEPLKPCKGKEVTAMGKKWKCDGLSLEDCPNSYTSSGQNTFFQCGISGLQCLTTGPQCKVATTTITTTITTTTITTTSTTTIKAPSCKALYDSGVREDGAYPISLTTPDGPTTKKLYCDMRNGGWTLIGQVAGKAAMYDGWLRAFKNEQNLETPQITSATWASIPAVDLAVNHATQVRLSNEDISKWVKWEMDTSRTVETWWNRGDGQSSINQATDHAVKVYNQDGGLSNCYQNKYGILQIREGGGSYPSAQVNGAGNTSPGDNCMSVGVQPSGTHHDGYSHNGNGYDQPDSNSDWPNGDYQSPPFVNVWVGGAVAPAASSCKALYDSGVKEDGAYPISLTTPDGPTTKKLYCDMKNGGWTLIGQVAGKAAMYDGWLRAFKNEQNLETPQITSATWASIPAVDLAVNHATQVRLSNEDISKWVKWEMDTSRTVETWWNRGDGQSSINQATDHAVKVYNQYGGSSNCYQNKYGIMQISAHGGSYPSAQVNGAGNTSPGDNCMSVGVQPSGTHDGYSQNGNGYDQPDSNSDWPNGDYRSPPFVNVWVGGADAAPAVG